MRCIVERFWCSMRVVNFLHYHMNKDETWYVEEGEFIYRWIDTEIGQINEDQLSEGDVVRQRPGQPHQIKLTDGRIFEVSTHHEDSDSYRVILRR